MEFKKKWLVIIYLLPFGAAKTNFVFTYKQQLEFLQLGVIASI